MLKIIITTTIALFPVNIASDIQDLNCEYLYFSGQGTEIQNQICASEYERIHFETLQWKREALESRGIY